VLLLSCLLVLCCCCCVVGVTKFLTLPAKKELRADNNLRDVEDDSSPQDASQIFKQNYINQNLKNEASAKRRRCADFVVALILSVISAC